MPKATKYFILNGRIRQTPTELVTYGPNRPSLGASWVGKLARFIRLAMTGKKTWSINNNVTYH